MADRSQFGYYKTGRVFHWSGGVDCCNATMQRALRLERLEGACASVAQTALDRSRAGENLRSPLFLFGHVTYEVDRIHGTQTIAIVAQFNRLEEHGYRGRRVANLAVDIEDATAESQLGRQGRALPALSERSLVCIHYNCETGTWRATRRNPATELSRSTSQNPCSIVDSRNHIDINRSHASFSGKGTDSF